MESLSACLTRLHFFQIFTDDLINLLWFTPLVSVKMSIMIRYTEAQLSPYTILNILHHDKQFMKKTSCLKLLLGRVKSKITWKLGHKLMSIINTNKAIYTSSWGWKKKLFAFFEMFMKNKSFLIVKF